MYFCMSIKTFYKILIVLLALILQVKSIDAKEIITKSKNLSFAKNIIAVSAVCSTIGIDWKILQKKILIKQ